MQLQWCFATLISMLILSSAADADTSKVTTFIPTGSASNVRSVKAKFSEAMVPAGDPTLPAPFTWDCNLQGDSAWVDAQTWTLNLGDDLAVGTACNFKLKAGTKSLAGNLVDGTTSFQFAIAGLNIAAIWPYEGSDIEEDQAFAIALNGAVTPSSLIAHGFIKAEGISSPIGIKLIEGARAAAVLQKAFKYRDTKDAQRLVVAAATRLPNSQPISIIFEKGITGPGNSRFDADKTFAFKVRDPFRISATCSRDNDDKKCNPFSPVRIEFNNRVAKANFDKIKIVDAKGRNLKVPLPEWNNNEGNFSSLQTIAPLAPQSDVIISITGSISDQDGRTLTNANRLPIHMPVDNFPALAKFASDFGVIEWSKNAAVPVTVRNLEAETKVTAAVIGIAESSFFGRLFSSEPDASELFKTVIDYYESIDNGRYGRERHLKPYIKPDDKNLKIHTLKLPKVLPPKETEVVGIPVTKPGFHLFQIASQSLADNYLSKGESKDMYMYVPAAYQVTNLGVHLKLGRENSLIWVTNLGDGTPAGKSKVTIMGCGKKIIWTGQTDKKGVAMYEGDLSNVKDCGSKGNESSNEEGEYVNDNERDRRLYVFAQQNGDFAFATTQWDQGLESWRWSFPSPYEQTYPQVAHSIMDRSLFRAGERAQFKHILRRETTKGFALQERPIYDKLKIVHEGSNQEVKVPVTWQGNGSGDSSWSIPKDAKLGYYQAYLVASNAANAVLRVADFEVQEFRVPLTKGYIKVPTEDLVAVQSMPLKLGVQYLAGGGVANLASKLVIQYRDTRYHLRDKRFEDFRFNFGPARTDDENYVGQTSEFETIELNMDGRGEAAHAIDVEPTDDLRSYHFEMNYLDPNGETRTYAANKEVLPKTWSIGIDSSTWLIKSNELNISTVLVDEHAKPLANKTITVTFHKRDYLSHRKKLAGGVYSYENTQRLTKLEAVCTGTTDNQGRFSCKKALATGGNIIAQVATANQNGQPLMTNQAFYVSSGKNEDVWFESESSDRIDVLADKKEYQPGETATLQVRSPFRQSTALITSEREGILDYEVLEFKGNSPTYDLPVKAEHAPNIYVTVFTVRGRNDDEKPTAMVDLGKPAFKIGKINLKVGWKFNRLIVDVKPERKVYQVRDNAKVTIKVRGEDGTPLPSDAEVAIAVVDEGLLELKGNQSWNLLEPMMNERPLAVQTYTSQMQVIGKRHYGLKAMNLGGDGNVGSSANPRELFDTLLLWQPHLPVNAAGEATFSVRLNDSLTSFRIAAVATAGTQKFGAGYGSFSANKDIILFAGLPPVVRTQDQLSAKLSLRNTTGKAQKVLVTTVLSESKMTLLDETVDLPANSSKDLYMNQSIALAPGIYVYETTAKVGNVVADQVLTKQQVIAIHSPQVQQASLEQLTPSFKTSYAMPADAVPGVGSLRLSLQASLLPSLASITAYAKAYPYSCFEQQLSKAIMLDDQSAFKALAAKAQNYLDGSGLLKYFPSMHQGSPSLTTYALQITHARGWTWPDDIRSQLLNGLTAFAKGQSNADNLSTHHLRYARISAMEALSRYGALEDDALESIELDINSWPTAVNLDLFSLAQRTPRLANRATLLQQLDMVIQGRLSWSGSKIGFQTDPGDGFEDMLTSADVVPLRLTLAGIEFKLWRDSIGKYIKGSIGRLKTGHWDTTTANAWGMVTAKKFSETFESQKINGTTNATYGSTKQAFSWANNEAKPAVDYKWQEGVKPLDITHNGSGAPWLLVQSIAAIARSKPYGTGLKLSKLIEGLQGANPQALKVGDLLSVTISVTAQSIQDWLVINDPVPSGATLLGKGLGGESMTTSKSAASVSDWPTFVEMPQDRVYAYFERVKDGLTKYTYTMRINNAGTFVMPVTRAEAMYEPEVFSELPNAPVVVRK